MDAAVDAPQWSNYEPSSVTVAAKAQETITPAITASSATTMQVTNPQPGVTYTLCDAGGTPVAGVDPITAAEGDDVVFEGCTPGATYTVMPSIADDADTHYTRMLSESATTPKQDIAIGTALPTAIERTYNGTAQTLVTSLASEDLPEGCTKVLYSIQYAEDAPWNADTANWTEDPSKGVNAQTYYIHVKYVGDDQHKDLVYDKAIEATIVSKSLSSNDIGKLVLPSTMVYSGAAQGPAVVVTDQVNGLSTILANGTDYTIEYGTAIVYNGSEQGPVFSVSTTLAEGQTATTLENGVDYTLTGNTATGAGTYTATVVGTGNFTGTVQKSYTIAPYKVGSDDTLSVAFQGGDTFVYNGDEQKPSNVTVTLNDTRLDAIAAMDDKVKIMSGAEDVTANYDVSTVPGTLTITQLEVVDGKDGKGYQSDAPADDRKPVVTSAHAGGDLFGGKRGGNNGGGLRGSNYTGRTPSSGSRLASTGDADVTAGLPALVGAAVALVAVGMRRRRTDK